MCGDPIWDSVLALLISGIVSGIAYFGYTLFKNKKEKTMEKYV